MRKGMKPLTTKPREHKTSLLAISPARIRDAFFPSMALGSEGEDLYEETNEAKPTKRTHETARETTHENPTRTAPLHAARNQTAYDMLF
jgi:hypothetical protein